MKGVEADGHQISDRRSEHSRALYVMRVVPVLRSIEVYPVLVDLFSPTFDKPRFVLFEWSDRESAVLPQCLAPPIQWRCNFLTFSNR